MSGEKKIHVCRVEVFILVIFLLSLFVNKNYVVISVIVFRNIPIALAVIKDAVLYIVGKLFDTSSKAFACLFICLVRLQKEQNRQDE